MFDQALQDLRSGARILRTSPGLSATAIVLIALFIGGNITIYSMVQTLLTKPAPGVDGGRLVVLGMTVNGRVEEPRFSHPDYVDFAAQSSTVRPLLSSDSRLFTLTLESGSYALRGATVSTNYFDTLGVRLARGRTFTDAEGRLERSGLVAVVSDAMWNEHFQRADDIVGRQLTLNGHPTTIVGVAPARFEGPMLGDAGLGVWVPAVAWARTQGTEAVLNDRAASAGVMIGRLAPGRSMPEALAEFAAISARLQAAFPESRANTVVTPIRYSMTAGGNSVFALQAPRFLAIFSIVTIITLGIVCANVANLLLARVVARQREIAVRLSLGATRIRILRLLASEGIVLSIIAWAAAYGFAWWVSQAIIAFVAPAGGSNIFSLIDFTPDWRVAGYAMLLALTGAVAFTLAPASRAWRQDLLPFLKAGEQGVVQGRSRLSSVLAVVQLAFAVLLLTCAGLAYRSLTLIEESDLGFSPDGMLVLAVNTAGSAAGPAEHQVLAASLRDHLLTVPGVQSAAQVATVPPFGGFVEPVRTPTTEVPVAVERNLVGPGYFELLGVAPLSGRNFTEADDGRATPIAVINKNLADALWPGESPLGRTVFYGQRRQPLEIVGVVPNSQYVGFRPDPRPSFIFLPERQNQRQPGQTRFYIRHTGALESVVPAIRASLRQFNASVPVISITSMTTALESGTSPVRALTTLLTLFAVGSLLVAAIGLYGAIAFNMRRRTRDFGVRLALGASSSQILRLVFREGLALTAAGVAAGFVLSAVAGLALRRLLLGVTPTDPLTYLAVLGVLALVSLLACYVPARRAASIKPVEALRAE